jgi:hypothetical protein
MKPIGTPFTPKLESISKTGTEKRNMKLSQKSRKFKKFQELVKRFSALALLFSCLIPQLGFAGKIDDVKKAVKEKCNKNIPSAEVMDVVLKVYDCTPDSDVVVGGCTIKCMKSSGAVVGGSK